MNDIALVSMPFGPVMSPSIALGLLKSALAQKGFASRSLYFTIDLAEQIGTEAYFDISDGKRPSLPQLAGEWIFNGSVFGTSAEAEKRYVESILFARGPTPPESTGTTEMVLRTRALVDRFLDRCADKVLSECPKIVGFTSIFQQHVASLALAKRLKERRPDLFVIFGGANCEGIMGAETVRQFQFVDAAVSGEGEVVFPELVRRVLGDHSIEGLPGVRTRASFAAEFERNQFTNAPAVERMDDLAYPDYGDYFEQFEASLFGPEWQPSVFYETSRGCWWGERQHCTFCGLNGGSMKYRSKSAPRAMDELLSLIGRHPGCDVEVTDNILDLGYFHDFLPELAARKLGVSLFYETKANLRKEQVRLLRDAGVLVIQPGIESLSDSVLKLMRKGVSALQNIQLLKWSKELGVQARWNILAGFPGEDPQEYEKMAELAPLLTHLMPPSVCSTIRLDRFSPNFFDSERLGFANIQPLPSYREIYAGLPLNAIHNLAYYFTFEYREPCDTNAYLRPLVAQVREWQRVHAQSALFASDDGEQMTIWDLRPVAVESSTVLSGLDRALYTACDAVADLRRLVSVAMEAGLEASAAQIERRLQPLIDRGLLVRHGNRFLALAIAPGEYQPDAALVGLTDKLPASADERRACA